MCLTIPSVRLPLAASVYLTVIKHRNMPVTHERAALLLKQALWYLSRHSEHDLEERVQGAFVTAMTSYFLLNAKSIGSRTLREHMLLTLPVWVRNKYAIEMQMLNAFGSFYHGLRPAVFEQTVEGVYEMASALYNCNPYALSMLPDAFSAMKKPLEERSASDEFVLRMMSINSKLTNV